MNLSSYPRSTCAEIFKDESIGGKVNKRHLFMEELSMIKINK